MHYTEVPPSPALAAFVRCYWILRAHGGLGDAERILPDGCCELIVNLADPMLGLRSDGTRTVQPDTMLVGQIARSILVAPTGAVDLLGIRFQPGGLHALLPVPMRELTDRRVDLDQVSRALKLQLQDAAHGGAHDGERLERVEACLLGRIGQLRPRGALVAAAVAEIERRAGRLTIDELSGRLGEQGRTLERRFGREVGLSPKTLACVVRFQSVVQAANARARPNWAALALGCGYFDQAHMIRDFRRFAGVTPAAYHAGLHALSDCLTGGGVSDSSNPPA